MKRSLEDIRRKYAAKSPESQKYASNPTLPGSVERNQAIKKNETYPMFVSPTTEALKAREFVSRQNQSTPADEFSKIDISASVVANELGGLYANETVGGLFSKSDDTPSVSAGNNTWLFSTTASKLLESNLLGESVIKPSNRDFSEMDFSSTSAANNLDMLYSNDSISICHFVSNHQDLPTTACNISKKQSIPLSEGEAKSIVLDPQVDATHSRTKLAPRTPVSDGIISHQPTRIPISETASIPQTSHQSIQQSSFDQERQFVEPNVDGPATNRRSCGEGTQNVLKYADVGVNATGTSNYSDCQLVSVPHWNSSAKSEPPLCDVNENNCYCGDYLPHQYTNILDSGVGDNSEKGNTCSSKNCELILPYNEDSSENQKSNKNVKPIPSYINENDAQSVRVANESLQNHSEANLADEIPLETEVGVSEQTTEASNISFSYSRFEPEIHSTPPKHTLSVMPVIQEESLQSNDSADPVEISSDENVMVFSIPFDSGSGDTSGSNDFKGGGVHESIDVIKKSACDGSIAENCQSSLPRNCTVSPRDDSTNNFSQPSTSLKLDDYQDKSKNATHDSQGNCFEQNVGDFPVPEDYHEDHWLIQKANRPVLGTSGCSYDGEIFNAKIHGHGRFYFGKNQYIEGIWNANRLVEPMVCRLTMEHWDRTIFVIKTQKTYLVSIFECDFFAKAMSSSFKELDFSASVADLKTSFIGRFKIVEIIGDEMSTTRDTLLVKLIATLEDLTYGPDEVKNVTTLFLLNKYTQYVETEILLSEIDSNQIFPATLRAAAATLCKMEASVKIRNEMMKMFDSSVDAQLPQLCLPEIMANKFGDLIERHRRSLTSVCPINGSPKFLEVIQKLPNDKILYMTRQDVHIFGNLLSLPCVNHHETREYVCDLFERFLEKFEIQLENIDSKICPSALVPLISPNFVYIFKSFFDIARELVNYVDGCIFQDMLRLDSDNSLKVNVNILWDVQEKRLEPISYSKLLGAQYIAVSQMLSFYAPGNYCKGRKFNYEFNVLKLDSLWKQQRPIGDEPALSELEDKEDNISDESITWLFILDNTLHLLFKDCPKILEAIKLYNPLLQSYVSFLQKSTADTHSAFQIVTHSVIQFIVTSVTLLTDPLDGPGLEQDVLSVQIRTLTTALEKLTLGVENVHNFRDLTEQLKRLFALWPFIDVQHSPEFICHFSYQVKSAMEDLVQMVKCSLNKEVPTINLIKYLRSLYDFIAELKTIDFSECWFVKSDIMNDDVLVKIDNEISSIKCSYRVKNIEEFVRLMKGYPTPEHYIFEVVRTLIRFALNSLDSPWNYCALTARQEKSAVESLESTGMLLDAIWRSFMNLTRQPEYNDFETFKKERIEPFMHLVYDSKDMNEFRKRAMESFRYIWNENSTGIDLAIASFDDLKVETFPCKFYYLFLEHYDSFMEVYDSHQNKNCCTHEQSLKVIGYKMEIRPFHYTKWTTDFKTRQLPKLIAGVSAVWSILMGIEDGKEFTEYPRPHPGQIESVMRLLSMDKLEGVENHIAQVPIGQGKSMILDFAAVVLALTGHEVRVVCFSRYLSERYKHSVSSFFQQFGMNGSISYGNFHDMMDGFLTTLCDIKCTSLAQIATDRILEHTDVVSLGSGRKNLSDTVLLIDEVDLLFNDDFYLNYEINYSETHTSVKIPGLAYLQQAMYNVADDIRVFEDAGEVKSFTEQIPKAIEKNVDPFLVEWIQFLGKPGKFCLLAEDSNGKYCIKEYTNKSLLDEHLLKMAQDAVLVARTNKVDHLYKLNEKGELCKKNSSGRFVRINSSGDQPYQNAFAYAKLKNNPFDQYFIDNFGRLHLKTGSIFFDRLSSQFPLILGVTGTLKDLSEYEKARIDSYNITAFSIFQPFFGDSLLEFNSEYDFTILQKQEDWISRIYHKVNGIVQAGRAVLIFFESDVGLKLFADQFKAKFDRINEITMNTDSDLKNQLRHSAGMPGTVTLATRPMGRGIEYKSSSAVEEKGGIHVIQTFFSGDVREEIHIRGRTARRGNKGSYELVICGQHLIQKGMIRPGSEKTETYSSLCQIRKRLRARLQVRHIDWVSKFEHNHDTTMRYYGLSSSSPTNDASVTQNVSAN